MAKRKNRTPMDKTVEDGQSLELSNIGDGEWVFSDQDTKDEIYELFEMALDLMEESKFGSAKSTLKKVLKLNPDHIDAIHHLAIIEDRKKNKDSSRKLWKRGVEIGHSVIPEEFKRGISKIPWSYLENRPFLRCLHGHAFALHVEGKNEESITVFQEILDYNPDDNQGVRDILMEMYFEEGRYSDAMELADRYNDDVSPEIMYGRVLVLLLRGSYEEAEKELKEAVKFNPKVAEELLKKDHSKPEGWMPGYIRLGDWDEAYLYWMSQGEYWTSDDIEWLRKKYQKMSFEEDYEDWLDMGEPFREEFESEREFDELFKVAMALKSSNNEKRDQSIDKLADVGEKAVRPVLYAVECDAAYCDDDPEVYDKFNNACFEVMRRIGEPTVPILERFITDENVDEMVNVFAQEAIFKVLDLDEEERKKICKHVEVIPHEMDGETVYTCAICEKIITEDDWNIY